MEQEHLGPGTYARGTEISKKSFGGPMAAAFGSTDNRKLDTTSPGIIRNPGPGAYLVKNGGELNSAEKVPTAVFKSENVRK